MKRNITSLLCVLALSGAPAVADAQEMEPVENLKVDAYYQEWLADYEETGTKINELLTTALPMILFVNVIAVVTVSITAAIRKNLLEQYHQFQNTRE